MHSPDELISTRDDGLPAEPQASSGANRAVEAPRFVLDEPTSAPGQEAKTASFIERYAHMFADDGPSVDPPPTSANRETTDVEVRKPRAMGIASPSAESQSDDEEESIEQYMAKLLQRVRGESRTPLSQGLSTSAKQPPTGESRPKMQPASSTAGTSQATVSPGPLELAGASPPTAPARPPVRTKVPMAEQSANMEAFRALANESARRAISRHALRVHRRNAVTKVIVATLAGMTSVLLMLEAPHWRDLQFLTACVSLLVAAYWAGQTYGTMIESFRAAAYDGPELVEDELADLMEGKLPTDVH
jgi:hypothetical protein